MLASQSVPSWYLCGRTPLVSVQHHQVLGEGQSAGCVIPNEIPNFFFLPSPLCSSPRIQRCSVPQMPWKSSGQQMRALWALHEHEASLKLQIWVYDMTVYGWKKSGKRFPKNRQGRGGEINIFPKCGALQNWDLDSTPNKLHLNIRSCVFFLENCPKSTFIFTYSWVNMAADLFSCNQCLKPGHSKPMFWNPEMVELSDTLEKTLLSCEMPINETLIALPRQFYLYKPHKPFTVRGNIQAEFIPW